MIVVNQRRLITSIIVITLLTTAFVGLVAVTAAAQGDTMMFRYNVAHTGDYSTVAGSTPPNNRLNWNYTTGQNLATPYPYVESSPAVANGVVYIGSDDQNVYALNATTGAKLWNYTTGGSVISSPAVANGIVYVGSGSDDNLYALNATTGAKLWNYTTGGGVYSSPAVANGVVYIGSDDNNTYALYANNGTKLWNYTTGSYVESSPAVANGVVYVGSGYPDNNVYALNANNGTKLWNYTAGVNGVRSSPAVANGVVYVGSGDQNVYALYANNGTKLWNYTTKWPVSSSPAVANGVVYVGSDRDQLYALNANNGTKLWNYTTGWAVGELFSSPAVANGVVYFGNGEPDNNVYALYANNGTKLWNYTTGNIVTSSPAVVNGVVYVGSWDGNVYAIGNQSARISTILTASAPSSALVNQNFSVTGQLTANGAPFPTRTVYLQRSTNNVTFMNVTSMKTNDTGGYAFSRTESATGIYYYRTAYDGNATYANATSNVVNVTVHAGEWGTWEPLSGQLTASPAAVSWGDGRIDVFVIGSDNALWHRTYA